MVGHNKLIQLLPQLAGDAAGAIEFGGRGIEPAGFSLLPITGEQAAKVAELPMLHNDPFDRMLVAASVEPMLLLTNDETLRGYGSFVSVG